MRSPIPWFGGKGNMLGKLRPLIPRHKIYVEPFGGAASLLFSKEPKGIEVYNDIDSGLVGFFRVLRDKNKFEEFCRLVSLTPYSRQEWRYCKENWEQCKCEVESAYMWFIVARMSFSGEFGGSWSNSVSYEGRGMVSTCSKYLSTIEMLPEISQRLMRVQIENADWKNILERYDRKNTFFYLDPPYLHETRRGGKYKYEMSKRDHKELILWLLNNLKGKVMLSGYLNSLYEILRKKGWKRKIWKVSSFAVGRTRRIGLLGKNAARQKQPRLECVWMNYDLEGQ